MSQWKCAWLVGAALVPGAASSGLLAQDAPREQALPGPELATSARVTSTLEPTGSTGSSAAVGVGTQLIWRITIDDPERDGVALPDVELGPEWAMIDGPHDALDLAVPKSSRPDLDRTWTLMPLAGGTLGTPPMTATFEDGATVEVPSKALEVLPSLGEAEEEPRPLLGFREAPDRRVGDPRSAIVALGGVLALVLGLLLWRRARKRRVAIAPAGPAALPPLEQIRALQESELPPAARMAALAPLFRRAFDEGLAAEERGRRAALTDEAWSEGVAQAQPEAARLILELSAYRYGGGEPTSFAVKDAIERASQLAARTAESTGTPEEAA